MASERDLSSPCCWLLLCCPPGVAAEALAGELKIPVETAATLLQRFRLIPARMQAAPGAEGSDAATQATEMLDELNQRARRDLRQILAGLGYSKGDHEAE